LSCRAAGLGEGRRQGDRKGEAGAGATGRKGRLKLQHARGGGVRFGDPTETAAKIMSGTLKPGLDWIARRAAAAASS